MSGWYRSSCINVDLKKRKSMLGVLLLHLPTIMSAMQEWLFDDIDYPIDCIGLEGGTRRKNARMYEWSFECLKGPSVEMYRCAFNWFRPSLGSDSIHGGCIVLPIILVPKFNASQGHLLNFASKIESSRKRIDGWWLVTALVVEVSCCQLSWFPISILLRDICWTLHRKSKAVESASMGGDSTSGGGIVLPIILIPKLNTSQRHLLNFASKIESSRKRIDGRWQH